MAIDNNHETRISVLETKVEFHANKLEEVNTSLDKLNDEMTILVQAVTGLNDTISRATIAIEKVTDLASNNNTRWVKFDSYLSGATKVVSLIGLAVGVAWTIFTFFAK